MMDTQSNSKEQPAKSTGYSVARAPGMKPIVRIFTGDEPRIRVPEELPTYSRVHAIHCGIPEDEIRMRAASLAESCFQMEVDTPVPQTLIDPIFRAGAVTDEQAEALRAYIESEESEYLKDEARLILEAGGHEARV